MSTKSTLSPPAPLDLGRLEAEAKSSAAKHVSNLLQRPEQLEKVDQYRRRVARKKASVEAMLKTAVQSQLDGVRTGLNQLQSALQDVYEIKQSLDEVEEHYRTLQPLHRKLEQTRLENDKFCQLATAMENLKHIFTVPESVRKTEELINDSKLLQAHKHLTELEQARDDLLFELYKQPNQSPTDKMTLNNYFAEVEKLSDSLGKQLWIILQRTLNSVRREPTLTVTVLRIIEREERMDNALLKRQELSGFIPPGRPKRWRDKCFRTLEDSIAANIEGNIAENREADKMWLVRHLERTRQRMIDDFRVVKTLLPPIFPPKYNIVKKYVTMYHSALSNHIQELISQGLEGMEFVTLLTWIDGYDSPELLKHPELNLDTSHVGPLLEHAVIDELQNQYLKNTRENIKEWTKNTLKSDIKDWARPEPPDTDGEGCHHTSLPVIVFQMMEQILQVAQIIGDDLVKKALELFADELNQFAQDYKNEIVSYRDSHLLERSEPRYFALYMIANSNNCLSFGDYMKQLRTRYLKNDIEQVDEEETNIRKDRFQMLTDKFLGIAQIGCDIVLDEVFIDLDNSKCLTELFTRQWVQSPQAAVKDICATWTDYSRDFIHLKPKLYQKLLLRGQNRILKEYVKSLLSRKMTFKNYDERRESSENICKEAEQLESLFKQVSSARVEQSPFSVLPIMAEVIKLKDTSMLSLEITGLVKRHPDVRVEQLINLLLCRGDMSRSEARQMVMDTIGEEDQLKAKPPGIFSELAEGGPSAHKT